MGYIYSEQNRLDFPHSYQYTKFEGKEFLSDYFSSRKHICKHALALAQPLFSNIEAPSNFFHKLSLWVLDEIRERNILVTEKETDACFSFLYQDFLVSITSVDNLYQKNELLDTRQILLTSAHQLINSENNATLYELLSFYVKKYEVTKKLYSCYKNHNKKPASLDFRDPLIYNLLSFCLLRYYAKNPELKFLNCALKLNDAVCSMKDDNPGNLLNTIINLYLEIKAIYSLIDQKKVKI